MLAFWIGGAILFTALATSTKVDTPAPDPGVSACRAWQEVVTGRGHLGNVYVGRNSVDPVIARSSRVLVNYFDTSTSTSYTQAQAVAAVDDMNRACTAQGWFR